MNTKIAALILGALAAFSSASPLAKAAPGVESNLIARDSAENSTAPGTLVTKPSPDAITHL
ncbi:MAG: hypothetical protein L6R41_007662, partial [Letrouitia leprolyta]